jgi:hypothetical protein
MFPPPFTKKECKVEWCFIILRVRAFDPIFKSRVWYFDQLKAFFLLRSKLFWFCNKPLGMFQTLYNPLKLCVLNIPFNSSMFKLLITLRTFNNVNLTFVFLKLLPLCFWWFHFAFNNTKHKFNSFILLLSPIASFNLSLQSWTLVDWNLILPNNSSFQHFNYPIMFG